MKKKKILILDDESIIFEGLKLLLFKEEVELFHASCIYEAWELIEKIDFDAVLSDCDLGHEYAPEDFMQEFCKRFPACPLIAMSGRLENREPALRAGARAFLPKPLQREVLVEVLLLENA